MNEYAPKTRGPRTGLLSGHAARGVIAGPSAVWSCQSLSRGEGGLLGAGGATGAELRLSSELGVRGRALALRPARRRVSRDRMRLGVRLMGARAQRATGVAHVCAVIIRGCFKQLFKRR